jgi:hypothetical protein
VLQSWRRDSESVERLVDCLHQPDGVRCADIDGLDEEACDLVGQTGHREALDILERPDTRLDADTRLEEGFHDFRRSGFGHVDRRVIGRTPGPHELETAFEIGLDPGTGRDANWDAARIADPRDDRVDDLWIEALAAVGVTRVQMNGARAGSNAGSSVSS